MSAFTSKDAPIEYDSSEATAWAIGYENGYSAGLESAAKVCEEEASNPDLPLSPIERYRASVLHDAIRALKGE